MASIANILAAFMIGTVAGMPHATTLWERCELHIVNRQIVTVCYPGLVTEIHTRRNK